MPVLTDICFVFLKGWEPLRPFVPPQVLSFHSDKSIFSLIGDLLCWTAGALFLGSLNKQNPLVALNGAYTFGCFSMFTELRTKRFGRIVQYVKGSYFLVDGLENYPQNDGGNFAVLIILDSV